MYQNEEPELPSPQKCLFMFLLYFKQSSVNTWSLTDRFSKVPWSLFQIFVSNLSPLVLFPLFLSAEALVFSWRGLWWLQRRRLRCCGQHPRKRRQNSRVDIRLWEPGSCDAHRVSLLFGTFLILFTFRKQLMTCCATSLSCQQESLQRALGDSHEDDYWLPVSRRHGHQKWFYHQEQIRCLRHAQCCASFISLSYSLLVRNVYSAGCNLGDTPVQDYVPDCSISCPGHEPQENDLNTNINRYYH